VQIPVISWTVTFAATKVRRINARQVVGELEFETVAEGGEILAGLL
jgi:hypothetical protein